MTDTSPTSPSTSEGPATTADPAATEQPVEGSSGSTDPTDEPTTGDDEGTDETERWKRRSRDWERRAKRNADLAGRFPDVEERANKLQGSYDEALADRARIEAELWRERAARAHQIPDDLVEFLTGSTEAEVMQRAERLASRLTAGPRRPQPDPTQGRGDSPPTSPADAFATYVRGALNR